MNENEYGIEEVTRAMTRDRDSLIGQEMTIEKIEKKTAKMSGGEEREVNLYTARLSYEKDG